MYEKYQAAPVVWPVDQERGLSSQGFAADNEGRANRMDMWTRGEGSPIRDKQKTFLINNAEMTMLVNLETGILASSDPVNLLTSIQSVQAVKATEGRQLAIACQPWKSGGSGEVRCACAGAGPSQLTVSAKQESRCRAGPVRGSVVPRLSAAEVEPVCCTDI